MTDDILGASVSSETDDDPLSGAPVDVTRELDAEDFDFDAFVDGVRPGRRAVRVTMRADLMADRDRIVIRAGELGDTDETEAEVLLEEHREVTARIIASQRVFVVEARSDHRTKQVFKQMEKAGHPEPGKKASEEAQEVWNTEAILWRLADAIVTPSNVTIEGLRKLYNVSSSEVTLLWGAFLDACNNPIRGVGVTPDFLRRR